MMLMSMLFGVKENGRFSEKSPTEERAAHLQLFPWGEEKSWEVCSSRHVVRFLLASYLVDLWRWYTETKSSQISMHFLQQTSMVHCYIMVRRKWRQPDAAQPLPSMKLSDEKMLEFGSTKWPCGFPSNNMPGLKIFKKKQTYFLFRHHFKTCHMKIKSRCNIMYFSCFFQNQKLGLTC